jgi:hypothetical protein
MAGMTERQLRAYHAKKTRELGEKDRLTRRYHQAFGWLETNFSSLGHWRRVVEQMEALIQEFRQEEAQLPPFAGSAFIRELVAENPVLWSSLMNGDTSQGETDGRGAGTD